LTGAQDSGEETTAKAFGSARGTAGAFGRPQTIRIRDIMEHDQVCHIKWAFRSQTIPALLSLPP
jgi:hypothetical protein